MLCVQCPLPWFRSYAQRLSSWGFVTVQYRAVRHGLLPPIFTRDNVRACVRACGLITLPSGEWDPSCIAKPCVCVGGGVRDSCRCGAGAPCRQLGLERVGALPAEVQRLPGRPALPIRSNLGCSGNDLPSVSGRILPYPASLSHLIVWPDMNQPWPPHQLSTAVACRRAADWAVVTASCPPVFCPRPSIAGVAQP